MSRASLHRLASVLVPLLVLASGCGGQPPPAKASPRPVVAMALEILAPNPPLLVTGVAEPYREAEVSFEVSGRITSILDVGRTVEFKSREKTPAEIEEEVARRKATGQDMESWEPEPLEHTGDVMAQIDDTSYFQRLEAARFKLETIKKALGAQRLDLEQLVPATIARAKAQRDAAESEIASARATVASAESNMVTARADRDRNQKLLEDRQISRAEFDQYQNAYATAAANLEKAQAGLQAAQQKAAASEAALTEAQAARLVKAEQVAQTESQRAELEIAVQQARTDLERCLLRAPFVGRVTAVYASQGDFVAAGQPVLRLTLIDPIRVSATVSADRERQILPGSHVRVQPKGLEAFETEHEELFGTVFEKAAVADAATRTFRIDVMVRNARRRLADPGLGQAAKIRFRELLPAVDHYHGEGGPIYICHSCCVKTEDGKYVVYRVKGGKFGQPRPRGLFLQRLQLERIEIRLVSGGPEEFMQILNWSFRHVEPVEGFTLEHGDLLINFKHLDPEAVEKGLVLERFQWAIRPGDLVPLLFDVEPSPEGFWVPDDAIRARNEERSVFAIEGRTAREIPVTVHESCGRLRRIEGQDLEPDLKLVVLGVHYLFDGAEVVVSRQVDLETLLGCDR